MSYALATETYSDTSRLLSELEGVMERVRASLGWTTNNIGAILPAWRSGQAIIVTDRNAGVLEGAAGILRVASAIHEADAMILFAAPVQGREAQLINYCKMVAKAHGSRGLAMSLDTQVPLQFLEQIGQLGFTPKALVYGVRL